MKKVVKHGLRIILILFLFLNIVTAFHAYKFTHFYNANEISIQKREQKTGLDLTREILFGINAVKRPNKIVQDSTFQTICFETKDNIKIEGLLCKNENSKWLWEVQNFLGH